MTPETRGGDQGQGGGAAEQAKDRIQEAVGDVADGAREKAASGLDQQSSRVGQQVGATASALRGTGDDLRQQGNAAVAQVTDVAAREAQRLGSYLEQTSGDQLLADVERYARRNPWAVVVGGMVVGAAAARMVKASSSERYHSSSSQRSTATPSTMRPSPVPRPPAAPMHSEPVAPRPAPDVPQGGYTGMA